MALFGYYIYIYIYIHTLKENPTTSLSDFTFLPLIFFLLLWFFGLFSGFNQNPTTSLSNFMFLPLIFFPLLQFFWSFLRVQFFASTCRPFTFSVCHSFDFILFFYFNFFKKIEISFPTLTRSTWPRHVSLHQYQSNQLIDIKESLLQFINYKIYHSSP